VPQSTPHPLRASQLLGLASCGITIGLIEYRLWEMSSLAFS
jgi:hypothetical protein